MSRKHTWTQVNRHGAEFSGPELPELCLIRKQRRGQRGYNNNNKTLNSNTGWRYSLIFKLLSKIYQYKPHNRYTAQPHLVVRFLMWIYLKNSGEFSIHWSFCKLRWYSIVHLNLRDTNTGSWNTIHGLTVYLVPITSTLDLTYFYWIAIKSLYKEPCAITTSFLLYIYCCIFGIV